MANEVRGSEAEVKEMKKQSPLIKWGATAGAIAAIITLGGQIGGPVLGWIMSSRDAKIEKLQGEKAALESRVRKLEELAEGAIDASEKRFQQNEKHSIALRGSVESLRNEVRVRHGEMGGIPMPPVQPRRSARRSGGGGGSLDDPLAGLGASAPRASSSVRRPTRQQAIAAIKEEADDHLSEARTAAPRAKSLRDMIAQGEKPEPVFDDDF